MSKLLAFVVLGAVSFSMVPWAIAAEPEGPELGGIVAPALYLPTSEAGRMQLFCVDGRPSVSNPDIRVAGRDCRPFIPDAWKDSRPAFEDNIGGFDVRP